MDWSIQHVARLAGTTSRTLRHYDDIGLLAPSRVGANGYRYYDELTLTRLQRILLLRQLGLALPAIGEILAGQRDDTDALVTHLVWLRDEQARLDRQIASVEMTITRLRGGEQLMAEEMFDGFDPAVYRDEVSERWDPASYAAGADWWASKTASERAGFERAQTALAADWADAARRSVDPASDEAQQLATRQHAWLSGIPGLPRDANGLAKDYFIGLGEMYVADDRFAANYGGTSGAEFVRDAMRIYATQNL